MSATNVAQRKFCYTTQTQTFPLNCYYSQWSEVDRDSAKQFSPMVLFFFFSFSNQFHSVTTIFAAARDLTTPKFHFPCFHGSAAGVISNDFRSYVVAACKHPKSDLLRKGHNGNFTNDTHTHNSFTPQIYCSHSKREKWPENSHFQLAPDRDFVRDLFFCSTNSPPSKRVLQWSCETKAHPLWFYWTVIDTETIGRLCKNGQKVDRWPLPLICGVYYSHSQI